MLGGWGGEEIFLFSLLSSPFPSETPNTQAIKDITECGHEKKLNFPYPYICRLDCDLSV